MEMFNTYVKTTSFSYAKSYRDAPGHGRVDIPHFVIWFGYDFGKGWSLGTEIEFERGGEVAING